MRMLVTAVTILAAVFPMQAMAYIDPGSGSAIMSAIVGFFVATAMLVKTYWYKIKSFFAGSKLPESEAPVHNGDDDTRAVSPTNSAPGASAPGASSVDKRDSADGS